MPPLLVGYLPLYYHGVSHGRFSWAWCALQELVTIAPEKLQHLGDPGSSMATLCRQSAAGFERAGPMANQACVSRK